MATQPVLIERSRVVARSRVESPAFLGFVDAIPESKLRFSSKVVQHPIEDGSVISDHVIRHPTTMNMLVFISDMVNDERYIIQGESKQQAAWNELTRIYEENELISITNPYNVLDNMVITSLDWSRSPSKGLSLDISMNLTQVTIVERADLGSAVTGETRAGITIAENETEIPLNNNLIQIFNISLPAEDVDTPPDLRFSRVFLVHYQGFSRAWFLDILTTEGDALVRSRKLNEGELPLPRYSPIIGDNRTRVILGTLEVRGQGTPRRTAWGNTHKLVFIPDV